MPGHTIDSLLMHCPWKEDGVVMPGYSWIWLAVCAGLLLVFIVICCSHIIVDGCVTRRGTNDHAELQVKALFGLITYKAEIPVMYLKETEPALVLKGEQHGTPVSADNQEKVGHIDQSVIERFYARVMDALRFTRNLTGLAKRLVSKIKLTRWEWSTSVGTGDAVWTAMSTGLAWSVQSAATGILSKYMRLCAVPILKVEPRFNAAYFETRVVCTAQIRLGYVMLAGIRLFGRILKVRGGIQGWLRLLMKPQPGGA